MPASTPFYRPHGTKTKQAKKAVTFLKKALLTD